MQKPVSYKGNKPYIFVSYSHMDSRTVWPIISRMQEDGYYVWYDEGIAPGSEWADYIDQRLCGCYYFFVFLTRNYLNSENCKDELNRSRDAGIRNRLLIYLEDVNLEGGLALRNSRMQAIFWNQYGSQEQSFAKLYTTVNLEKCRGQNRLFPFGGGGVREKLGIFGGFRKTQPESEEIPEEEFDEDLSATVLAECDDEGETELAVGYPGIRYLLTLTSPTRQDLCFEAELTELESVQIGRSQKDGCQIVLTGENSVSRKHCMIYVEDDQVMIRDLNSTNGTYLDGKPVTEAVPLTNGGLLKLGNLSLNVNFSQE